MPKYDEPDWATRHLFNPIVALITRAGLSVRGSRLLAVRGRKSGEWRTTPVNLLNFEGGRYLVAPRGDTQWSRNIRAAGGGELRIGSKKEPITVTELGDDEKPGLLRAYLKLWSFETGKWFEGVRHDSPDEDVRRIAGDHPVFKINER